MSAEVVSLDLHRARRALGRLRTAALTIDRPPLMAWGAEARLLAAAYAFARNPGLDEQEAILCRASQEYAKSRRSAGPADYELAGAAWAYAQVWALLFGGVDAAARAEGSHGA